MAVFCVFTGTVLASEDISESNIRPRISTDEVENQITLDREANLLYESRLLAPIHEWKNGVAKKTGFNWSLDYSALFMGGKRQPGERRRRRGFSPGNNTGRVVAD